jgi:hypothetical protein
VSRTWNYVIRKGVSISLRGIAPTIHISRRAEDLLFKGYPDTLMKLAKTFPFFANADIPQWERFGWFYMVNPKMNVDKEVYHFLHSILYRETAPPILRVCSTLKLESIQDLEELTPGTTGPKLPILAETVEKSTASLAIFLIRIRLEILL